MNPKIVETLEARIEEAITEVVMKLGRKKLPMVSDRRIMHLMAKAAVTVYEAAVENEE